MGNNRTESSVNYGMDKSMLNTIWKETGLGRPQFAETIGVSEAMLKHYLSGRRQVPKKLVPTILGLGTDLGTLSQPLGTAAPEMGTVLGTPDPETGTNGPETGTQSPEMGTKPGKQPPKAGTNGPVGTDLGTGLNLKMGTLSVAYRSDFGPEWDIMSDGYARGYTKRGRYPDDSVAMRAEFRTPGAYMRIVKQEAGVDTMSHRTTKKDFDKVDWKKLNLPNFEKIGLKVREDLRS